MLTWRFHPSCPSLTPTLAMNCSLVGASSGLDQPTHCAMVVLSPHLTGDSNSYFYLGHLDKFLRHVRQLNGQLNASKV